MKWLEIAVCVPVEGTEPLAEIFIEMGTGGVAIEDPALISAYEREIHPDEWAVPKLETAEGTAIVRAYIPLEDDRSAQLAEIKKVIGRLGLQMPPKISTRTLEEEDWAHTWKKYYKPLRVGRRLVIKPSWEGYRPLAGDLIIELDPGMAFGSGTHATTALCLELLEEYVRPGSCVYDIGTGSGILAIAAARLGAGRVQAVDIDPVACKVAAENVAGNHVDSLVRVQCGNPTELLPYGADLIVANIIADVITDLAPRVATMIKPGGIFIASGIVQERADMVRAAFAAAGLIVGVEQADGLWLAIVANKKV